MNSYAISHCNSSYCLNYVHTQGFHPSRVDYGLNGKPQLS